jgi:hypothetical protein
MRADLEVLADVNPEQLQKLLGLEELIIVLVVFRPHPDADMHELFDPLVQCVQGLAGAKPRCVLLRGLALSERMSMPMVIHWRMLTQER